MRLWYNGDMKRTRRGFTLVEVALFLAITAVIFVSIAVGTQNSIFQQRYSDAVQNFAEFLRSMYSQVSNVQSEGTGRTEKAIYGKLITFGESDNRNKITSYNVIGRIGDLDGNVLEQLKSLDANVVIEEEKDGEVEFKTVGLVENYTPRWASQIQTGAAWGDDGYKVFEGTLLIVRHPRSGTIYTYSSTRSMDINGYLNDLEDNPMTQSPIVTYIGNGEFTNTRDVVFCVNPNGAEKSSLRRGIRVAKGARNASGVEILPDGEGCL